jgi:hypothetical protein
MRCAQNVTAKLAKLSEQSDTLTGFTDEELASPASITTPHLRFTKAFSPKLPTHLTKLCWRETPTKKSSSTEKPVHDDYGDDTNVALQKFYDNAEPNTCYTLEEIAQGIGVTRERVRQIEAEAIKKFRRRFAQMCKNDGIDPKELFSDD